MATHWHPDARSSKSSGGGNGRYWLAFWGFLAIAGFFLVTEHTAHLLGALPYLLLLACPLMHVFMHGRHGHHSHQHHGNHDHQRDSDRTRQQAEQKS
jgi:hypothetical protein